MDLSCAVFILPHCSHCFKEHHRLADLTSGYLFSGSFGSKDSETRESGCLVVSESTLFGLQISIVFLFPASWKRERKVVIW